MATKASEQNYRGWEHLKGSQRKLSFAYANYRWARSSVIVLLEKLNKNTIAVGKAQDTGLWECLPMEHSSRAAPRLPMLQGRKALFLPASYWGLQAAIDQRLISAWFATENRQKNLQAEIVLCLMLNENDALEEHILVAEVLYASIHKV